MAIGKTFKFGKTLVNVSGRGIATKDTSTGEIRRFGFPWANRAGKGEQEAEDGAPSREYARYEDDASDLYENDDRYTRDSYEDTEEDESYDEDEVNAYDEGDAEPEPGRGRSLVDAPWFMWAMLVILPPLGIWLLWRNNRFEITPRSIISGAAVIWFIIMLVWLFSHLGGGGDVPVLPDLPTTSPTVEATATPEPTDVPTATPEITQEAVVTPQAQNTPVPDDLTGTGTTTQAPDNTSTSEGTTPTSVPFVWSTPTGKYYHSYATCSNMTNASKVTLSVALNRKQEACPLCWVPPEVTPKPTNTPLPANMFYSTPNGEYYHLDPACSGMRNAQVISQAEAMSTRGQSACPICIGSVYMTEGGTYFHANSTCSGMKNARLVTVNEAQQAGKLPCPECQPLAANGGANQVFGSATSNSAVGNAVFYMTDGGTYYHSEPNCSGMRNARETSAREAETAGKLPCPVCMNGLSGQVNYYATPNGKYYHTDRNCSGMQNASTVTVAQAESRGQTACPVCIGDTTAAPAATAAPGPTVIDVQPEATQAPTADTSGTVYYSTIDGKYFHTTSDCSGMKGATTVTAEDIALRNQSPCPVCIGTSGVYYSTPTGQYYHSRPHCSGMKNADVVTLQMIRTRGQTACPVCIGTQTASNTTPTGGDTTGEQTSTATTGEANGSYFATPTGTYYHANSTCSGMRNAVRVTQATAEARGQLPCPVCLGGSQAVVTNAPTATPAPSDDTNDSTLMYYTTDNGQYYHRNSTCSGMRGAYKVSESAAVSAGKTPCPVCIGTVWATANGDYYHSYATCSGMSGASLMTVDQAELSGKSPCPVCLDGSYIYGTTLTGDDSSVVYLRVDGENYHIDPTCQGMTDMVIADINWAASNGYTPCEVCKAPSIDEFLTKQ